MVDNNTNTKDVMSVKSWWDYWTDPGTVTLLIIAMLMIPMFLILIVEVAKAQFIVNMYMTFATSGILTAIGHATTDYAKSRAQENSRTPTDPPIPTPPQQ
jgi:hypothetical protein